MAVVFSSLSPVREFQTFQSKSKPLLTLQTSISNILVNRHGPIVHQEADTEEFGQILMETSKKKLCQLALR